VGFFAGKMDYARLKWSKRLFAMRIARMPPGDRRNWVAIRNWATRLPAELSQDQALPAQEYSPSIGRISWVPAYPDLTGKVAMVTGANDGIGRATALGLAKLSATVVMVCRDRPRGEAAQAAIRAESGNPAVELLLADLSSQAAVRNLAAAYQRTHAHLHILVNNAGASAKRRTVTADGIELSFAINYLAPFLLTNLLLDVLKASAPARIVNVTSAGEMMGRIDFEDLMGERAYSPARAYNQSKLANVLFTYELARRLEGTGVTANCLHPGFVKTKMTARDGGGWMDLMIRLARRFALTPEQGAQTTLYLASSPEVQGVSGKYFENKREKRSSPRSYDPSVARRLWLVSERLMTPERHLLAMTIRRGSSTVMV
jgi:retinol dehydrogenase-14